MFGLGGLGGLGVFVGLGALSRLPHLTTLASRSLAILSQHVWQLYLGVYKSNDPILGDAHLRTIPSSHRAESTIYFLWARSNRISRGLGPSGTLLGVLELDIGCLDDGV